MYKVVVGYLWPKGDKSPAIFWIHTMSASTLSITVNSTTSIIVNSRKQTGNWMSPKALSGLDILSGRNSLPHRVQPLSNTNICTQLSSYPIYIYIERQKSFLEWWCQFACLVMNLNHLVVHLHAKFYEWRILTKDARNTNIVAVWNCQLEGHSGVRNCSVVMYDGKIDAAFRKR